MADDVPFLPPATTPQGRENQLVSLAFDLAEKQLIEGTASAQVITQLLKWGSQERKQEREKKDQEIEYLRSKVESMSKSGHNEDLLERAMSAFSDYSGRSTEDDQIE